MKITIEIADKLILDYIDGAGIGYWANVRHDDHCWDRKRWVLHVVEVEGVKEPKLHVVTRAMILRGLALLASNPDYVHHYRDLVEESGDMYTGDALVQCAIFGELKYG